jgi:hypothetical protein
MPNQIIVSKKHGFSLAQTPKKSSAFGGHNFGTASNAE